MTTRTGQAKTPVWIPLSTIDSGIGVAFDLWKQESPGLDLALRSIDECSKALAEDYCRGVGLPGIPEPTSSAWRPDYDLEDFLWEARRALGEVRLHFRLLDLAVSTMQDTGAPARLCADQLARLYHVLHETLMVGAGRGQVS